tara:strand:- start:317 stop:457 length:141 start_codon:yes stop_codon:yes gene_type:complete
MKYHLISEKDNITIYRNWGVFECKIRTFKLKQLNLAIRYMNYINKL